MKRDDLKILTVLTRQFAHYCTISSNCECLLNELKQIEPDQLALNVHLWNPQTASTEEFELVPVPADGAKVLPLEVDTLKEFKTFVESRKAQADRKIEAFKVRMKL